MKSILYVDDHEVLARLSCEILQMQGYRADYAYNAADALNKFENGKYDILVTDYCMEGMNGLELARQVRQKTPDVPVIIVTGYEHDNLPCEAVSAWLEKQDMFPALLDQIKLLLGENDPQESPESLKTA